MSVHELNPESEILRQLDGQWQKICMLLLLRFAGKDTPVRIGAADFAALNTAFPDLPYLYVHGVADGFELRLISRESAERLAAWDATQRGHA